MSNQINDDLREHLQYAIDNSFEIATFIKDRAQLKLNKDDFEGCMETLEQGYKQAVKYVKEEVK